MTNQTCKIILACKASCTLDASDASATPLNSVVEYLSSTCGCPKSVYTNEVLYDILFETMCDYLDTCDKPSTFLYQLRDTQRHTGLTLAECIASIFVIVEVYGPTHECVNGFKEKYISEWENLRAELMQPNDNKGVKPS